LEMKRLFGTETGFARRQSIMSGHRLLPVLFSALFISACGSDSSSSSSQNENSEMVLETGTTAGTNTDNDSQVSTAESDSGSTGGDTGGTAGGTGGGAGTDAGTNGGVNASPAPAGDSASSSDTSQLPEVPEVVDPEIDSEETSFFFSYDESSSTASRDLALSALDNGRKPDPALGRAYEFLNAEQLVTSSSESVGPFNVSMGLLQSLNDDIPTSTETTDSIYGLGVSIVGPTQTMQSRRNVVLTVLLDISGSMDSSYADETSNDITSLLDVAKLGLIEMQQSLKAGDVINLVTFATQADVLLEAHSPTSNSLTNTIQGIVTTGSTDIENGVDLAYQVANRTYDANKANRVVIITDAYVNTGELDPNEIARHTTINGLEGIHFSGVGVGAFFNDSVLNTLTDVGKGSYSAMITPEDAQRIFTRGFDRFLNPAVRDVRFQLTYPQEMDQLQSFAEEISTVAAEVQTINFSFNSSQYFLELFSGPSQLSTDGELRLDITYEDDNGQAQSAFLSKGVNAILGQDADEIRAATAVVTLAELINGNLTCDNVLSSQLYNQPVQHDVYVRYIQHIDRFCSL